jgi:signal recognition particle subunit SRP54
MGDILSLVEKAEQVVDHDEAERLTKKLQESKFDMNDLLKQLQQIQKMGSVKSLLGMFPGIADKVKDADIDEKQFVRIQAMITSMTDAERVKPSIINPSRKRRIANGSGCKVEDVNRLLRQFEQMQQMMKQFGKNGKATKKIKKRLAGMDLRKFGN